MSCTESPWSTACAPELRATSCKIARRPFITARKWTSRVGLGIGRGAEIRAFLK